MRALDLFCGAGGATKGLQRAGFHVTGVDIVKSPRYCGDAFIQADALDVDLSGYDFIWASPVCKRYSGLAVIHGSEQHPDHIPPIRERLRRARTPYAIENVVGAPLIQPLMLCGTMFGLRTWRHRLFELSWLLERLTPPCNHAHEPVPVYGHENRGSRVAADGSRNVYSLADRQAAMGIDWMTRDELSQAIPPAFSEWIARQFLAQRRAA
jgi:DNA (cytosine-5)-methyltransferase 1